MIRKHLETLILITIWIVSLYSVVIAVIQPYQLSLQTYLGYGALISISALKVLKIKRFKTILGLFLIAGTFNLIQFTYFTFSSGLSITLSEENKVRLAIQPLNFSLLILFIAFHANYLLKKWQEHFAASPSEKAEWQQKVVNKYLPELKKVNDEKLAQIIANKSDYETGYVLAVQQEIDNRRKESK